MSARVYHLAFAILLLSPYGSAQWVEVPGPQGGLVGRVDALAARGAELFVGTTLNNRDISYQTDLFHSHDNGESWVPQMAPGATAVLFRNSDVFVGTRRSGIFVSANDDTMWRAVSEGVPRIPSDTTRLDFICSVALSGSTLFAGTSLSGVLRSTNSGSSWTAVNSGLTDTSVSALAVSGTNLFAGTEGGVFLSTNNGTSWTRVNSGLTDTSVSALAVSGTNLFAGTRNGGVFISTNNGTSWTQANNSPPNSDLFVLCFAVSGGSLFAGTTGGVFLSTNNGTTWQSVSAGLPNLATSALGLNDSYIFAGTCLNNAVGILSGKGVWRRPLSEMITAVEASSDLPTHFALEQNYPNPFNPSTTINYELPKSANVRLSVYDMLGREVSVLVNERRDAGVHDVKFDASGLSSGVYFYRLQVGDFVQSKRMLILK